MNRKLIGSMMLLICFWILIINTKLPETQLSDMAIFYIQQGNTLIQSPNIITSIYLYFRYYDTLFEALMLLFSILGIISLSVHIDHDDEFNEEDADE